jgi:hypothetical protein
VATGKSVDWRQSNNASFARHSENRPQDRVVSRSATRVTTPLALASDTGGFAAWQPLRQDFACHRASHWMTRARLRSGSTCPQGPTGIALERDPALGDASFRARFAVAGKACGLCGQLDLDCRCDFVRPAVDYYTVIICLSLSGRAARQSGNVLVSGPDDSAAALPILENRAFFEHTKSCATLTKAKLRSSTHLPRNVFRFFYWRKLYSIGASPDATNQRNVHRGFALCQSETSAIGPPEIQ